MDRKSRSNRDGHRISSAVKTILFVVVVSTAAGVLNISAIRPEAVSCNEMIGGDMAFAAEPRETTTGTEESLPTLMDLGADKCAPCKMMAPIIEDLRNELNGKLTVVFFDVWKDPKPGRKYGIYGIPTLIFFDENGKELYRHMGYYSKEAILDKWKELGYDFR